MVRIEDQPLKPVHRLKDKKKNVKSNDNYNEQLRDKHEYVTYDIKNTKCGRWSKKCSSFGIHLNLND